MKLWNSKQQTANRYHWQILCLYSHTTTWHLLRTLLFACEICRNGCGYSALLQSTHHAGLYDDGPGHSHSHELGAWILLWCFCCLLERLRPPCAHCVRCPRNRRACHPIADACLMSQIGKRENSSPPDHCARAGWQRGTRYPVSPWKLLFPHCSRCKRWQFGDPCRWKAPTARLKKNRHLSDYHACCCYSRTTSSSTLVWSRTVSTRNSCTGNLLVLSLQFRQK